MKPSEKFKLCPHCDGRAPLEVVICPFCAQNFHETPKAKSPLSASYTPPYSTDRLSPPQEIKTLQESPAKTEDLLQEKSAFLPIALLTIGCNLLALSLLLVIFNHEGKVELEWSSSYWLVYALLSLPLIFLGYKIIKKE